jgi:hypothetical protein
VSGLQLPRLHDVQPCAARAFRGERAPLGAPFGRLAAHWRAAPEWDTPLAGTRAGADCGVEGCNHQ